MRVDLANMLRQAAAECRAGPSRASLDQLRQHVLQVRDGSATLEEFADLYMLRGPARLVDVLAPPNEQGGGTKAADDRGSPGVQPAPGPASCSPIPEELPL